MKKFIGSIKSRALLFGALLSVGMLWTSYDVDATDIKELEQQETYETESDEFAFDEIEDVSATQVEVNATNFPDAIFREYLLSEFDSDNDNKIAIADVTVICLYDIGIDKGMEVSSLKGIEYFTYLEKLYCQKNNLTSLDLSNNTKLTEIDCTGNKLTSIKLGQMNELTDFYCSDNDVKELDLSKCPNLYALSCEGNQIKSLDVASCPNLKKFFCHDNKITTLDVSSLTKLTYFGYGNEGFKKLILPEETFVEYLIISELPEKNLDLRIYQRLTSLCVNYDYVDTINVTGLTELKVIGLVMEAATGKINLSKFIGLEDTVYDTDKIYTYSQEGSSDFTDVYWWNDNSINLGNDIPEYHSFIIYYNSYVPDKGQGSWVDKLAGGKCYYKDGLMVKDEWATGWDGEKRYLNKDGNMVINEFVCDGTYTYYLQLDGSPMKDRLTYHPDGEHVIYFDSEGHEVFSDFANVKKSISGTPVDDYCFFDVYGYLYVDVVTYDKEGKNLYYANPYGVLERGKWFQFSDTVMCADGTPWNGAAGNFGYANDDGTLMVNTWTYDWLGRLCYMQGNGVALY